MKVDEGCGKKKQDTRFCLRDRIKQYTDGLAAMGHAFTASVPLPLMQAMC